MKRINWEKSVYEVRPLNAKEYLGIEKTIRQAKGLKAEELLQFEGMDFSIGLVIACTKKDDEVLTWADVEGMPAKLFQAISKAANDLNTLGPKEEEALFFESSTGEDV